MECRCFIERVKEEYQIASQLSSRNDGIVLKLMHRSRGKALILKQYSKPVPTYSILADHKHPNIPTVYDCVSCVDGQVVLEEYIDGITAAQVLQTGLYSKAGAIKVLKEVCQAVLFLHSLHIVHRDIKPENVMITGDGTVKLIDLNASRRIEPGKSQDTQILGTIGYASYEQLGLAQSDERTDIFAMGVLLNVLITGEHPSKKLVKGRVGRIILKCTQIDPNSRYSSAYELLKAL